MADKKLKVVTVTTSSMTLELSEEDVVKILKKEFNMPKADVIFNIRHEYLDSVYLVHKTQETTNEELPLILPDIK